MPTGLPVVFYDIYSEMQKRFAEQMHAAQDAECARILKDCMRRSRDEWVLVGPVVCVKETTKALLVTFEDAETWVPKSQIDSTQSEVLRSGDQGMLVLREWIAKEKGWL